METTPEEKVWAVVKAIADGYELAPTQGKIILSLKPLTKIVDTVELKQILTKLAQDNEVIKIEGRPDDLSLGEDQGCYVLVIPDPIKFREFLNRAHSKQAGDISRLAAENFLAVCDVAMDLFEELQIATGEKVFIPIVRDIVRFNILCPAKSVNLLDRYGDFRMKALIYMKERAHILEYEVIHDMTVGRWDQNIKVVVDRYDFDKFHQRLMETYEKRVSKPARDQALKAKKEEKPSPPTEQQELPASLSVDIRDRQIWVNDFMLSKPHAVGGNKGFFEYVYENASQPLERDKMPDYVTQDVKGKSFSKVLNELGFKGEILKVFFPERGKSQLTFRKEVTREQLENDGIKTGVLLQELQLAHTRNSPK